MDPAAEVVWVLLGDPAAAAAAEGVSVLPVDLAAAVVVVEGEVWPRVAPFAAAVEVEDLRLGAFQVSHHPEVEAAAVVAKA